MFLYMHGSEGQRLWDIGKIENHYVNHDKKK